MVEGYHWATCLNVNQGVVHGVPTDYKLKKVDVLSVDIGLFYRGFHTDMAKTIEIEGKARHEFLAAGRRALTKAIEASRPRNRVGHISQAIEESLKKGGFQPIKALVGHGVGRELHEPPQIPCYLKGRVENTERLEPGATLAIEVIYAQGKPGVVVGSDGWTVKTEDGKLAALFEDTVAVTQEGPAVLTQM